MSTSKQEVVATLNQEVMPKGHKSWDEWESHIRDANVENTIIDRGKRWLAFFDECKLSHGKQGGSEFSKFADERFGFNDSTAFIWVAIGKGSNELLDNVKKFSTDYRAMYDYLRLEDGQKKILLDSGETIDRKAIGQFKKQARAADIEAQAHECTDQYPEGIFNVIVVDPPWPYGTEYDPSGRRAANPYREMSLEDIAAIDLPIADDCVMWLWTTHKFMRDSFAILDTWGFRDVAIVTWVKDRMGLGSWLRSQSEFCIMAVKGKPVINLTNQTTVINGPLREHSRKPEEFYEMVDGLCTGRKLDWFARQQRKGWAVYGVDAERFDE